MTSTLPPYLIPLYLIPIITSQVEGHDAPNIVNPMLLMREPGGWWGFHR